MLKKINGARRICYKGEERYIITQSNALRSFDNVSEFNEYPRDCMLIGQYEDLKNLFFVCASSDTLDDNHKKKRKDTENDFEYSVNEFSPLLVCIADMIMVGSEILDDNTAVFFANAGRTGNTMLEYLIISNLASSYILMCITAALLNNRIPDYSEAKGGSYYQKHFVTEWGEGEEGLNELSQPHIFNKSQLYSFSYNDVKMLHRAVHSYNWRNVSSMKLIREHTGLLL